MKRLFSLLTGRRFLFALALLATAVAAFYIIENWRGEKAWAEAQATLRQRGLPLHREEWTPPLPPAEENLALAPVFARLLADDVRWEESPWRFPPVREGRGENDWPWEATFVEWGVMPPDLRPPAHHLTRRVGDPPFDSQAEAATAILAAYSPTEPDLREMLAAVRTRPAGMLRDDSGQLSPMWLHIARSLSLRCQALAALGRADEALDCLEIMTRLARLCTAGWDPLILRVTAMAILSQTPEVYGNPELQRLLAPAQLARADSLLELAQGVPPFWRAMVTERLFACEILESVVSAPIDPRLVQVRGDAGSDGLSAREVWLRALYALMPRGWVRQNQARLSLSLADYADALKSPTHNGRARLEEPSGSYGSPYTHFVGMGLRGLSVPERASLETEAHLRLARLALAGLRLRQEGTFPTSLESLAAALPPGQSIDPLTGKPFGFKVDDQGLLLWSTGDAAPSPATDSPSRDAGHIVVRVPR